MDQIGAWIGIDCVRFVANWKVFFEIRGFSAPDRRSRQLGDPLAWPQNAVAHRGVSAGPARARQR